jgi:predicted O-methyltransferase YrrM
MNLAFDARWLAEIRSNAVACAARRPFCRKPDKTGTISEAACLYLRALVHEVRPTTCIEIGTFIGTSALVLAAAGAHVYTCDKHNDVFPSSDRITCYGKQTSTEMLTALAAAGVQAELVFLDGRVQDEDLPLLARVTTPRTVYALDDYEPGQKGVANAQKLLRQLPDGYTLWTPPASVLDLPSTTTIAVLLPGGWR